MLRIYEVLHAAPAFFFAYAGLYRVFNNTVALTTTLIAISFLIVATIISPGRLAKEYKMRMQERRNERTNDCITSNLQRVKSLSRPKQGPTLA